MEKNIKTIEEINEKIKRGKAVVVTADMMSEIVEELGAKEAAKKIDVVTTGTFGAMCSSGAILNFGHTDPPMKMTEVYLNNVPAYGYLAAVDVFIGAAQPSTTKSIQYGGAHLIEDLVAGKKINFLAYGSPTDCYPGKQIQSVITIDDVNQAILINPRNAYQRYNAATNSSKRTLYTYMGMLIPNFGNVKYSTSGSLSPLINDPDYETIGIGTRIFLGGGIGYIIGEGTQHNPGTQFGTLMVKGDLKQMNSKYLKGATFKGYGTSLFVGIGIPIPILNEGLAKKTAIKNENIMVNIIDYSIPKLDRPVVKQVSYKELLSGFVEINGKKVKASPNTSLRISKEIANELKSWIENGKFLLTEPIERLPIERKFKQFKVNKEKLLLREENIQIQNKTLKNKINKDENLCIDCGACISVCPVDALYFDETYTLQIDYNLCTKCEICTKICVRGALALGD